MKRLWLIRGVPGSGKSTAAHYLANGNPVFSADMWFEKDGEYKFNPAELGKAHENCRKTTEQAMLGEVSDIFVTNTFTREWEMEEYFKLAQSYGYFVFSLVVENRHGEKNVHGVPSDKVKEMKDRFEIKL
jgi:predicted kinase